MTCGEFAIAWAMAVGIVLAAYRRLRHREPDDLRPGEQTLQFTGRRIS